MDEILGREEFSLEDLLDHEDIISECKYLNADLVEYLSRKEVIELLINYVIQKPAPPEEQIPASQQTEEQERIAKYPYIASELFTCEVHDMLDCLFDNQNLLKLLFSFLDQEPPLDPANVSYFCKVVVVLIGKKQAELVQFIQETGQLEKLLNHIGLYSVMELLIRIGWDDGNGAEQVESKSLDPTWLHKADLVRRLVAKLDPKFDTVPEVHVNAACALVDVVVKTGPQVPSLGLLVQDLQTQPVLDTIFKYLFSGSASSLTNCLSVAIVLVQSDTDRRLQMQHDLQQLDNDEPVSETERRERWSKMMVERDAMAPILTHVVDALPKLLEYLVNPTELDGVEIKTQSGETLSPPFGASRLKIVELILALVRAEVSDVNAGLIANNCFSFVLDMCFQFPWNNMLHGLVESIVHTILDDVPPPDEPDEAHPPKPGFEKLKADMFKPDKGGILAKLRAGYLASEKAAMADTKKGCRLGFMGHLIRICVGISDVCLPEMMEAWGVSKEEVADWVQLCDGKLSMDIAKQQIVLGGVRPGAYLPQEEDLDGLEFNDGLVLTNNSPFLDQSGGQDDDDFFNWGTESLGDDDEDTSHIQYANSLYQQSTPHSMGSNSSDSDEDEGHLQFSYDKRTPNHTNDDWAAFGPSLAADGDDATAEATAQ